MSFLVTISPASFLNFETKPYSIALSQISHSEVRLTVRRNDTSSCSEPPSLSAIPSTRFHARTTLLRLRHPCALVRAYVDVRVCLACHFVSEAPLSMLEVDAVVIHSSAWTACSRRYTRFPGLFVLSRTSTVMSTSARWTVVGYRRSPTADRMAPRPLADVSRASAQHLQSNSACSRFR